MSHEHTCDHAERVVVLETKIKTMEEHDRVILEKLEKIEGQLTKYHGFIGGIGFVVSGAVVLWGFAKDWLFQHIK